MYCPLKLGEILGARSFNAVGEVNPMASARADNHRRKLELSEDNTMEAVEDTVTDPRSAWGIADALESIKWAFIFVGLASDAAIEKWVAYFTKLVRTQPRFLDAVRYFWDAASWRVAMAMRSGETFEAAATEVMTDIVWQQEQLFSKMMTFKGKGKGDFDNSRQTTASERQWQRKRQAKFQGNPPHKIAKGAKGKSKGIKSSADPCNKFNSGNCNLGDDCRYAHVCSTCGRRGHPAISCWNNSSSQQVTQQAKGKGKSRKGQSKNGKNQPSQLVETPSS